MTAQPSSTVKRALRDLLFFALGFSSAIVGIPVGIVIMSNHHLFPCWGCTP